MMRDEKPDLQTLEREFQRVGITWEAFRELDRLNQVPNTPATTDGSFAVEMDIPGILTLLRSLPNNAGQAAFVEAFRLRFAEPTMERVRAAARAEQHRGSTGA